MKQKPRSRGQHKNAISVLRLLDLTRSSSKVRANLTEFWAVAVPLALYDKPALIIVKLLERRKVWVGVLPNIP